jgi:hypothetical protein
VFSVVSHFHLSLVFEGKAGGCQSGSPYGTQLGCLAPSLADRYAIVWKGTDSDKHSGLLQYGKNYFHEKLYRTGSSSFLKTAQHTSLCILLTRSLYTSNFAIQFQKAVSALRLKNVKLDM